MNRRGFLKGILAAGVAPYVMSGGVASGVLMPVRKIWTRGDYTFSIIGSLQDHQHALNIWSKALFHAARKTGGGTVIVTAKQLGFIQDIDDKELNDVGFTRNSAQQ